MKGCNKINRLRNEEGLDISHLTPLKNEEEENREKWNYDTRKVDGTHISRLAVTT
jgi:hypothetical protein